MNRTSSSTFKSVPRAFHSRAAERERSSFPSVGSYRPKHDYVARRVVGQVAYGSRNTWERVGEQQAERIRQAQFEDGSKLCMCILKALDQEQVDLKGNRELKAEIYR